MKKLLLCRVYCDLAFAVAIFLVFYPLYTNPYTLSSDQIQWFYLHTGFIVFSAYLLIGAFLSFLFIIIQNGSDKMLSYDKNVFLFKAEAILLMFVLLINTKLELGNEILVENIALPFMVLFVVLSIFLLRTQRDLGNKTAIKKNIAISVAIMIFSLLLTSAVRQLLGLLGSNLVSDILKVDKNHFSRTSGNNAPQRDALVKDDKNINPTKSIDITRLIIILAVTIIIVVLLILFVRMIVRYCRTIKDRKEEQAEQRLYDENREFIKSLYENSTVKGKNSWARDSRGIVRALYAKFLRLCAARAVKVNKCDTTEQINEKYGNKYPTKAADILRGLYLKARYSDGVVDRQVAEQAVQAYKNIRIDSKN